MNRFTRYIIIIFVILLNISCDQLTKFYARENLQGKGTIKVIDNFFILHYAENKGAFLSMGSNLPEFFRLIFLTYLPAIILVFAFIYLFLNNKFNLLQVISLASVVGGGFSNIFDRIYYNGYVTDFLNFGIGPVRTGILNFADMSITFGAIIFILAGNTKNINK